MKKTTYLYGEIHEDGQVFIMRMMRNGGLRGRNYRPTKSSLKRINRYAGRKCIRRDNDVLSFAEYAI